MLRLNQVNLPIDTDFSDIPAIVSGLTGRPAETLRDARLWRRSVDARHEPRFVCSFVFSAGAAEDDILTQDGLQIERFDPPVWTPPAVRKTRKRIAVIGSGPAGLFCALSLCRAGFAPDIFERGADVDNRVRAVEGFWRTGILDERSNVQFGEGGAGTFSDGKLRTGIKDPRCRFVLETFVDLGAPARILYEDHPHIGTDRLRLLLPRLRAEIEGMGGRFFFLHQVTDIIPADKGVELDVQSGREFFTAGYDAAVLAVGHSARDTFRMLLRRGMNIRPKAFAVGLRIEHLQADIDRSRYRTAAGGTRHPALPPAEYALAAETPSGRKVYTFCMCPGGEVVMSASGSGLLAVNGMSYHDRGGPNANAALLTGVAPEDFGAEDPLAGVRYQERLEQAAFALGGGGFRAPAETVGSFLRGGDNTPGPVRPSCRTGVTMTRLDRLLPPFAAEAFREAIPLLDRKLPGFGHPCAILTGAETRSSSPVRLARDESYQSNLKGVYPCGEGAGFAGGIMSAAADGLRVSEAIADQW